MSKLVIEHLSGTYSYHEADSVRVQDGVLQVRRASYNGGVQDTIASYVVASLVSWRWA